MNNEKDVLKRLLKQYPVSSLREHFNIKVTGQEHVIEEILKAGNGRKEILNFSESNFEYCKQHIYIFGYNSQQPFPLNLQIQKTSSTFNSILFGKNTLTYFLKVSFKIYDIMKKSEIDLLYLLPLRLQYFYNSHSQSWILLVKFSVMEKSLNEVSKGKILRIGKDYDEKEALIDISNQLINSRITLKKIDLTKGVKELLETDIVDFGMAKFRKSMSISTETMDENYTIKQHNPEAYTHILRSPLEKTTCKFLHKDDKSVSHFRAEPENGMLSFSLFSPSLESIDNVINLLLNNNF